MSSIRDELKKTFDLASLRKEAKSLSRPADWEKAREIMTRHKREADKQEELYRREYTTRVERALQARIDQAGAKDLTFKHRVFGSDNFDRAALTRQAHRDVRHDNARRMENLQVRETKELDDLVATAKQRQTKEGQKPEGAKVDFQRAADRRVGPDRRQPQR